jgi:hypothetical protein
MLAFRLGMLRRHAHRLMEQGARLTQAKSVAAETVPRYRGAFPCPRLALRASSSRMARFMSRWMLASNRTSRPSDHLLISITGHRGQRALRRYRQGTCWAC